MPSSSSFTPRRASVRSVSASRRRAPADPRRSRRSARSPTASARRPLRGSPAYGAYYDGGVSPVAQGTPGIYPGTIGAFPDITSLATLTITPYLIDSNLIAAQSADGGTGTGGAELDCQHLIGQHGLGTGDNGAKGILAPSQFIGLAPVAAGQLLDGHTYLLSLTGCSGSYTLPIAAAELNAGTVAAGGTAPISLASICGPDFADAGAAGNVSVGIAEAIDTTTALADGGLGVQFAYRSTMIENAPVPSTPGAFHKPASAGVVPGIVTETPFSIPNDGGVDDAGNPIDAGTTQGVVSRTSSFSVSRRRPRNAQITSLVLAEFRAGPIAVRTIGASDASWLGGGWRRRVHSLAGLGCWAGRSDRGPAFRWPVSASLGVAGSLARARQRGSGLHAWSQHWLQRGNGVPHLSRAPGERVRPGAWSFGWRTQPGVQRPRHPRGGVPERLHPHDALNRAKAW